MALDLWGWRAALVRADYVDQMPCSVGSRSAGGSGRPWPGTIGTTGLPICGLGACN